MYRIKYDKPSGHYMELLFYYVSTTHITDSNRQLMVIIRHLKWEGVFCIVWLESECFTMYKYIVIRHICKSTSFLFYNQLNITPDLSFVSYNKREQIGTYVHRTSNIVFHFNSCATYWRKPMDVIRILSIFRTLK